MIINTLSPVNPRKNKLKDFTFYEKANLQKTVKKSSINKN